MKIDWNNAPDWAVAHALQATGQGIKEVWVGEDKYQQLNFEKSFPYGGTVGADSYHNPRRYQFAFETARPAPWTGEGIPPVGTVCELSSQGADWGVGTIQYTADNVVVWRWENQWEGQACACYKHEIKIRPIRTQEKIADEERAKTINQMEFDTDCMDRGAFSKLYDAGYRKVKS